MDGIETLRRLRADGLKTVLLTNKEAAFARRLLAGHDLLGDFDLIVAGDTLPDDCGAVQAMAQPVSVPLHQAGQALLRASATLASASGPLQVRSNALLLSRV